MTINEKKIEMRNCCTTLAEQQQRYLYNHVR